MLSNFCKQETEKSSFKNHYIKTKGSFHVNNTKFPPKLGRYNMHGNTKYIKLNSKDNIHCTWVVSVRTSQHSAMFTGNVHTPTVIGHYCISHRTTKKESIYCKFLYKS